jgi:hypothetical protein
MIAYCVYTFQIDSTLSDRYDSLSCGSWSRSRKLTEMSLPFLERATVPHPCLKIYTAHDSSGNPTAIPIFTCFYFRSPYQPPPPHMLHLFVSPFTHSLPSPPPPPLGSVQVAKVWTELSTYVRHVGKYVSNWVGWHNRVPPWYRELHIDVLGGITILLYKLLPSMLQAIYIDR